MLSCYFDMMQKCKQNQHNNFLYTSLFLSLQSKALLYFCSRIIDTTIRISFKSWRILIHLWRSSCLSLWCILFLLNRVLSKVPTKYFFMLFCGVSRNIFYLCPLLKYYIPFLNWNESIEINCWHSMVSIVISDIPDFSILFFTKTKLFSDLFKFKK